MRLIAVLAALLMAGCGARADQSTRQTTSTVAWHKLGAWSGHDSLQTESFTSDTGTLRIRWETTAPTASSGAPPAPAGAFRVTAHSAISGRPLQEVVDHAGAGSGTGYVQQDPHVFYLVVESKRVNWTFTVEEAIAYP